MAVEYNFTLDMDRSKRDNNIAYARTGDLDSIVINADLVFNGAAYTPTGANAFFECVTPNGCSVRAAAEKTGSSVSVEVPSAAFQAAGVINVAYFRFETGDTASPSYVESTEPFAIVVREGIGDNIDTGDYIEGWRLLADQIEALKDDVEQKAEQAKTAISEQKEEVDELKSQAQIEIAGDVTTIDSAKTQAISDINGYKADVANAAEGITEAGEQAISQFTTNSQQAINSFNTKGESAVGQFNTNGTSAINQFNTNADNKLDEVDGMITEAQGDVNAAITQLETATSQAVDAMEDALEGTTAGSLQNAINRALKLDIADMTNIPDNASLSSFTNVGSYCCKTASTAATIGDSPIDDGPFNMYVFSSSTSGQVMQLVVPIDLQGKPTAEWHVRFGTSSAMDSWSVIGGGADIAAGLGIDVAGDAQKTVSLDTTAFYEHVGPSRIVSGSTEVTGGGRFKELIVYGNTRQNLWVNPSGTNNGIKVTSNEDGSITFSGTSTGNFFIFSMIYSLKPGSTYTLSINSATTAGISIQPFNEDGYISDICFVGRSGALTSTAAFPQNATHARLMIQGSSGVVLSGTYRVMLNEGSEAQSWCPPGINSVNDMTLNVAGENILAADADEWITSANTSISIDGDTVTVSSTSGIYNNARLNIEFLAGMTVYFAAESVTDGNNVMQLIYRVDGETKYITATSSQHSIPSYAKDVYISLYCNNSAVDGAHEAVFTKPYLRVDGVHEYAPLSGFATTTLPEMDPLMSIDDYADELIISEDGVASVNRKVKRIDADTPGWGGFTDNGTTKYISVLSYLDCSDAAFVSILSNIAVSNVIVANDSLSVTRFACNGTTTFFRVPSTESPTNASEMVEYMRGLGAYCYVPVGTTTEQLGTIQMSRLFAPTFNAYLSGGYVPSDIEADVVKVDYLKPYDSYTREEVDKKIEAAGGMPDIVPVSQGGTGVTTAAAERNRLGLGNTTGPVPIANGGTGKTTAKAAQNALLADINTASNDASDETIFVGYYSSPSDVNGAIYKRAASTVWNWIASKIRSVFGFSSSNVLPVANGGTGSNTPEGAREAIGAGTSNFSGSYNDLAGKPQIPSVPISVANGGTGGTSASSARTNLDVYSKSEVDGKIPKVVVGSGNIPGDAEEGTIYINYQ